MFFVVYFIFFSYVIVFNKVYAVDLFKRDFVFQTNISAKPRSYTERN